MKEIESHEECKKIQERIARLASTVAIIKIGADTEIEMIEKRHRYEDALEAVVAAQDKGYVPGGGVTLLRISNKLRKNKLPGISFFDFSHFPAKKYQFGGRQAGCGQCAGEPRDWLSLQPSRSVAVHGRLPGEG